MRKFIQLGDMRVRADSICAYGYTDENKVKITLDNQMVLVKNCKSEQGVKEVLFILDKIFEVEDAGCSNAGSGQQNH